MSRKSMLGERFELSRAEAQGILSWLGARTFSVSSGADARPNSIETRRDPAKYTPIDFGVPRWTPRGFPVPRQVVEVTSG